MMFPSIVFFFSILCVCAGFCVASWIYRFIDFIKFGGKILPLYL